MTTSKSFVILLVSVILFLASVGHVRGESETNDDNGDINCHEKVENGECNSSPHEMTKNCLMECFESGDFGAFGFYADEEYEDEEMRRKDNVRCHDVHKYEEYEEDVDSCEDLAMSGECAIAPDFMLFQCAKSCFACREKGVATFPIGVAQEIHEDDIDDPEAIQKTADAIVDTFAYMSKIMSDPQFASVRAICRNNDAYCSALASSGTCEMPENFEELPEDDEEVELYQYMRKDCAAACQSCEDFVSDEDASTIKDCIPNQKTNIFGPGDLNKMFERIVSESVDDVKILSRPEHPRGYSGKDNSADYHIGPWVVTLDNFLSDEECDHLVELGSKRGYERSELEEEKDYDEEELEREINSEDAYRTSKNTWCEDECYSDPVVQGIIARLSNATGIPDSYAEYLQLLSYVPGQYYKEHHDISGEEFYQFSGPRMITFFLYLSDVEEGGSTRLTDLGGDDSGVFIDVQPKKGMALIWPSVLDENPMMMDKRTFHEALPVLKGRKYAANAWFYLRSYKENECDSDALAAIGEEFEEEEESDGDNSPSATELHDEL